MDASFKAVGKAFYTFSIMCIVLTALITLNAFSPEEDHLIVP